MKNCTLCKPVKVGRSSILLSNIFMFDSFIQGLVVIYCDIQEFGKDINDLKQSLFCNLIKTLVLKGVTKETYKMREKMLQKIFTGIHFDEKNSVLTVRRM